MARIMSAHVRSSAIFFPILLALSAAACHPSAQVRQTTPIANLQSYRVVMLRIGAAEGQEHVSTLAAFAVDKLRQRCRFEHIVLATQTPNAQADLLVDLNILRTARGGGGLVQNPNLATVDVSLVLSDGINDELLGSAEIRGQSSAVAMSGVSPEAQAVDAVAKEISEILFRSGCDGPRVARAPDEPDPEPEPDPGISEEDREQAEAANEDGKQAFRTGNISGARGHFERAISLNPRDPRYLFNLCLAQESLREWQGAMSSCRSVLEMNPGEALAEKAALRIEIIEQRMGQ
jgi:hypothetical protein